jgi:hypothetical protein
VYCRSTTKERKKVRKKERKKEREKEKRKKERKKKERTLYQLQGGAVCNVKSRFSSEDRLCQIFGRGSGPGTESSASLSVVPCQI